VVILSTRIQKNERVDETIHKWPPTWKNTKRGKTLVSDETASNPRLHDLKLALNSCYHFIGLPVHDRSHRRRDRLGETYGTYRGGNYSIFLDTIVMIISQIRVQFWLLDSACVG
jgi:hypothetical protein